MASQYNEAGYFYDEQFRRYILQFMRLFGGFMIKTGRGRDDEEKFRKVPIRYSDMQRMVGHILKNNSENVVNSCPFITAHILTLQPDRSRTLNPLYSENIRITERDIDRTTGKYTTDVGAMYSVERAMPTPYTLTMQVDIWTSNTDQKMQLFEQILVLFNPAIELQSDTNLIDWTSLFMVELTDISWSSRGVPQGVDSQIEIGTMTFTMPIWISPPVKISKQNAIHQIMNNYQNVPEDFDEDAYDFFASLAELDRQIITPADTRIEVSSGQITLLNHAGLNEDLNGNPHNWSEYLLPYGGLREGITQLRLRLHSDPENISLDIIGTITTTATLNVVAFTPDNDSLPGNNFTIDAIINPQNNFPGDGTLPVAAINARYLILDDIGATGMSTPAWGSLIASKNDIIQYNGSVWVVHFDSSATSTLTYIKNTLTSDQFKWDGEQWLDSYQGTYFPGYWRIVI